jgi:peptidyl-prolyl cis-trans isomerase A (cyclophilin A)
MKRRVAILAIALFPVLAHCQTAQEPTAPAEEKPATEEAAPATEAAAPKVRLKTNMGDIVVELNPEKAPITVENFLTYVKDGHYDGTVFHRVINGFMIQGGGMDQRLVEKKTRPPIKNESENGLKNDRGTIAMARTPDRDSATAQFFINVVDNPNLNFPNMGGYAVFGKVVEGMDVMDKIKEVPTRPGDVPTQPVVIESAAVVE